MRASSSGATSGPLHDRQTTESPGEKRRLPSPFRLRRPRGLLWFWTIGLAAAGLVFWITWKIPALDDLLRPGYWLIGIVLAVFTVRWFRPRTGRRRRGERRQDDRREDSPAES